MDKGSGVAGWAFWAGGLLASWAIRPRGGGFFSFSFLFLFVVSFIFLFYKNYH